MGGENFMEIKNRSIKYNPLYKKIYTLWHSMMQRCYQETNGSYKNYGARGVYVADEWKTLDGFIRTIDTVDGFDGEKLLSGEIQLDKDIKFKGNMEYSPEKCMFVSKQENYANRRNNRFFIGINLETEEVIHTNNREEFCRNYNLDSSTVWRMLQKKSGIKLKKRVPNIYRGWVFFYDEDFDMNLLPDKKEYIAENIITGEIVTFYNQTKFAKKYNLNPNLVSACINGRQNKTGDWKIKLNKVISYKDSTTIERQLIDLGLISKTE